MVRVYCAVQVTQVSVADDPNAVLSASARIALGGVPRASCEQPKPLTARWPPSVLGFPLVLRDGQNSSRYSLQGTEYVGRRHYSIHRIWMRRFCPVTGSARDDKSVRLNWHSIAMRVNSTLGQFARNRPVLWCGVLVPCTCRAPAGHSVFIGDTSTVCLEIRCNTHPRSTLLRKKTDHEIPDDLRGQLFSTPTQKEGRWRELAPH